MTAPDPLAGLDFAMECMLASYVDGGCGQPAKWSARVHMHEPELQAITLCDEHVEKFVAMEQAVVRNRVAFCPMCGAKLQPGDVITDIAEL